MGKRSPLVELMAERGLTVKELAEASGVNDGLPLALWRYGKPQFARNRFRGHGAAVGAVGVAWDGLWRGKRR